MVFESKNSVCTILRNLKSVFGMSTFILQLGLNCLREASCNLFKQSLRVVIQTSESTFQKPVESQSMTNRIPLCICMSRYPFTVLAVHLGSLSN